MWHEIDIMNEIIFWPNPSVWIGKLPFLFRKMSESMVYFLLYKVWFEIEYFLRSNSEFN